ncbi:MAG TPA: penicillin-binding protein 2 [Candidatus Limnocylindria bacterium]|nr:penicillin-binding protein 2 [Candidatus Limnocylindria bacterium]
MNNHYKLRSTLVFLGFCGLYLVVAINLYIIQIAHHTFYEQLGQKQYNSGVTILPPRACIYDRSGTLPLAMNRESLSAFLLPKTISSPDSLKPFLQQHFPQAYERLEHAKGTYFMYIARKLTDAQLELIQTNALPDIQLLNEPNRFYPVPSAGHVLGITDIDNKGLFGLELFYNEQLAGTPSSYSLEKDARSGHFYFKKQTMVEGKEGTPLCLTLDGTLQFLAYEELKATMEKFKAKEGSVIVMNPATGEIIVMVTFPDFDPNNTKNIIMEYTKNRIVTEEFELGSAIKPFGALASLAEKVTTADELIDCQNTITAYVDGRRVNTVKSSVAGVITFSEVIEKSNNIGIVKVIRRLGTKLYDHYTRIGFGKKTGIEFLGERSGFVNHPHNWSKQSFVSLSIGYEMSATLLQLACAFCMIANDGYSIIPTLIKGTPPRRSPEPLYDAATMATLKQILEKTVQQGTAKKAQIKGYKVMCKTGTANLLVNGQYDSTRNIYTSAGIVEKGNYQRVIVTFIKECPQKDMYASSVSAPLFERVAEKTLIHDKIM